MLIMNYHYQALESASESILERFVIFLNKNRYKKRLNLKKNLFDKLFFTVHKLFT